MFLARYNKDRFNYIEQKLKNRIKFIRIGNEKIRKTASFYSKKYNFYIDTSDGINEDIGTYEYCGRILKILKETKGKKFIYFKSAYSEKYSSKIKKLCEENNGLIIPFFKWSFNANFYKNLSQKKEQYLNLIKNTKKKYQVGFCAKRKSENHVHFNPDRQNSLVSWKDKKYFGFGIGEDTGFIKLQTRQNLYELLSNSKFNFFHADKLNYDDFILKSIECIINVNPPGIGEYTSRMFDHSFLGLPVVMRKTSYDFGISYKKYFPQIDFKLNNWETKIEDILKNIDEWSESSYVYHHNYWQPEPMINYMLKFLD